MLRKFWNLSRRHKVLLVEIFTLTVVVRLALRVVPFHQILRLADQANRKDNPVMGRPSRHQIVRAARASARRLLGDRPCLTQALVVLYYFRRNGYPATLRIGVHKETARTLKAHAWIENGDRIEIGYIPELPNYTPLPPLSAEATAKLFANGAPR